MIKRWMAAAVLLIGVAGCGGGGPRPGDEGSLTERGTCTPTLTGVEVNAGTALVKFTVNCRALYSGYNIYISKTPLARYAAGTTLPEGVSPWNHGAFPGDTNPEDGVEIFEAEGLEDGTRYYVHVRTIFADRTLSLPSQEVGVVPGPRGVFDLAARYKSEQDGFSFARNGYTRADDLTNDIYFYSAEGNDFLASPDRLGFLRTTRFRILPFTGDFYEVSSQVAALSSLPGEDRVAVREGDWIQVMTEDKTFALLEVRKTGGNGEKRQVTLFYAYSPAVGAPVF